MKKLELIVILFIILLMNSCNRNGEIEVREITDKQKIEELQKSGVKGIPFPEGSKVLKLSSNEDNTTKIILPEDVYFVVKNEKGDVFRISEMGVRCTCSRGSGCSPVSVKGSFYCVMNDGCKTCSSSSFLIKEMGLGQKLQIVGMMDENKGIVPFAKEKTLFHTTESVHQYGITEDFFKCKEVKKSLEEIYSFIYSDKIPDFITNNSSQIPSGYVYTKIDFYGNNILVPVPKNDIDANSVFYSLKDLEDNIGEISCTCYKGKGCKSGSMFGAKYCDAGSCTDCAMK